MKGIIILMLMVFCSSCLTTPKIREYEGNLQITHMTDDKKCILHIIPEGKMVSIDLSTGEIINDRGIK